MLTSWRTNNSTTKAITYLQVKIHVYILASVGSSRPELASWPRVGSGHQNSKFQRVGYAVLNLLIYLVTGYCIWYCTNQYAAPTVVLGTRYW